MPKTMVTTDQDAVVCELEIAAPPERVFQALTSQDQLFRWWNGEGGPCRVKLWEMEARLGGKWRCLAFDPSGQMVVNGCSEFETFGEIVEFDPPRALAYTWLANFHSIPSHRAMVRWELIPQSQGTFVRMTHSGLKPLQIATDYANGWPGVIGSLKKFAEAQ
ncbi:MAG: SRPBCC domain-containing protein [Terriglobales bacterium]|jgi:uncharacterized protein YndB with AHSA1/START domain